MILNSDFLFNKYISTRSLQSPYFSVNTGTPCKSIQRKLLSLRYKVQAVVHLFRYLKMASNVAVSGREYWDSEGLRNLPRDPPAKVAKLELT